MLDRKKQSLDWVVVILQLGQDGESIDVLSLSSQHCGKQLVGSEESSIFWVLEMVVLGVLPDEMNNLTPGSSVTANHSCKLRICLKQSSCVPVSWVHSALAMHPFSPESCQPGHPVLGLDLVVPVVPRSTSVRPPSCSNLIILHPDNYLLPLTFSLQRNLAVSQKTDGP